MKKYAVACAYSYDNRLSIEIIKANSIKEALGKHSKIKLDEESWDLVSEEDFKEFFFDMDILVDAVEIPNSLTIGMDSGT